MLEANVAETGEKEDTLIPPGVWVPTAQIALQAYGKKIKKLIVTDGSFRLAGMELLARPEFAARVAKHPIEDDLEAIFAEAKAEQARRTAEELAERNRFEAEEAARLAGFEEMLTVETPSPEVVQDRSGPAQRLFAAVRTLVARR